MHRLRDYLNVLGLAAPALFVVLCQSALLWHQHDSAAHDHSGPCEVCIHSQTASGPTNSIAPSRAPVYRIEERIIFDRVSIQSFTHFTAFYSRAPPFVLSS